MACGVALMPGNSLDPTLAVEAPPGEATFDHLMKQWFPLTYALNSLNRSLGMPDAYPFALAPPVVEKLRFVDRVIAASERARPLSDVATAAAIKPAKPSATRSK
jgi:hypothetical protein